jgi:phospholipid/cholesterol/gamma-HCH transport system permease protein
MNPAHITQTPFAMLHRRRRATADPMCAGFNGTNTRPLVRPEAARWSPHRKPMVRASAGGWGRSSQTGERQRDGARDAHASREAPRAPTGADGPCPPAPPRSKRRFQSPKRVTWREPTADRACVGVASRGIAVLFRPGVTDAATPPAPDAPPAPSKGDGSNDKTVEAVVVSPWPVRLADAVFAVPMRLFAEIGTLARLLMETVLWGIRPPYRPRVMIEAMEFIGVQSVFLVALTGFFVGAVFSLQVIDGFRRFSAEGYTGTVIGLSFARELAPVFASLMVSARAGSAIATELGSMRVSSQIDALTTMSVSPVQYLVLPRIVAGLTMVPIMALLFNLVGLFGAYTVATVLFGLDGGMFQDRVRWFVDPGDLMQGLAKAAVFGVAVTLIACRQGYYASGGAAGVGLGTNRAVVHSAIAILVLDYVVTTMFV